MIQQTNGTGYVYRNWGDFPDNTGSWTILLQFKFTSIPVGIVQLFKIFLSGNNEFIKLISSNNTLDLILSAKNHAASTGSTTPEVIVEDVNNWVAITYSSGVITLILNGVAVDTVSLNLALSTWDTILLLADSGGSAANVSAGYFRAWSSVKSIPDLTTEVASILAASQTGLIWDNPFQASIDLTSHNNTLNQLSSSGTVATDTTDSLLSITSAPPTNTAANLATVITPDSAIFQNVVTAGAVTNVWFSYTPSSANIKVASYIAWTDTAVYAPKVQVWDNLTDALTGNIALAIQQSIDKRGLQLPVIFGTTYYIRAFDNTGAATGILQISILEGLYLSTPAGSYAINDDDEVLHLPLVLMDRDTGYPINFINDFATGEGAQILDDGKLLASNEHFDDTVILYDTGSNYAVLATTSIPTMPFSSGFQNCRMASDGAARFIVASPNGNNTLRITILNSSAVITDSFDLSAPSIFLTAIGVTPDFSRAYVSLTDTPNRPIKTIDIAGQAYLTDLNAGIVDYGAGKDILCLGTDIILVPYWKTAGADSVIIKKYDSAGAVLATGNYDAYVSSSSDIVDVRICRDTDDTTFILWIKGPVQGKDIIIEVLTSDLSVVSATPVLEEYESGQYVAPTTATPLRFGHSESCPIWVTMSATPPVNIAASGLYTVSGTGAIGAPSGGVALIRHDQNWIDVSAGTSENVKIPDPYYDTFLAGDE